MCTKELLLSIYTDKFILNTYIHIVLYGYLQYLVDLFCDYITTYYTHIYIRIYVLQNIVDIFT